jgi:geranylgeranyl reductase family protein
VDESREVVVVGGGPAGSATAIFLRQRGHDVVLLDEARFPRDKICGEGISPEAWRLLTAMGAAGAVRALEPHPLRGMTVVSPNGTAFSGGYRENALPGFALRRAIFDRALLDTARASGVEVREGVRITGLLIDDGHVVGVQGESRAGATAVRARLVVGADGRRSVVARRLGLLEEHASLRKFAVRGYWNGVEGLEERGEMHVAKGGYCGIAPLSDGAANVTFVLDRRDMKDAGGGLEAFYRRLLRERWPRVADRLGRATLTAAPRAIGPLAIKAKRVSLPGAVLVGDSAGFYDPFTGEGVTLALRSAELAAEVSHAALGSRSLGALDSYDRERRAATRHKFRLNHLILRLVESPALANAIAKRLARRRDLADQLVGIAGDFVPARTALGPVFLWRLLRPF